MQLTDLQIEACSLWKDPAGVSYLEVPHVVPFYFVIAAGATKEDVELGTPAEFAFRCKVVSSTCLTPGTLIQIQWPDGRYLSNPGIDFFSFVGTGRRGRNLEHPKVFPPSSKIRFNLDNSAVAVDSELELFFEGVLLVPMVKA